MELFYDACKHFGLTISLKKTNIVSQNTEAPSNTTIEDYEPEIVNDVTYLGSPIISRNLSLDTEIDKRIGNQPLH